MVTQPIKKFPAFYGTWCFITMFTRVHIGPYPKPDETSPHPHTLFFKINFNILFPSMPMSSKWPVLFRLSKKYSCMHVCYLPWAVHALSISPPWYNPDNTVWRVYITKLLIMKFSLSCYFLPLRSKYSPQNPQTSLFPPCQKPWFTSHTKQQLNQ
jgi:hypothetical protein